MYIPAAQHDAYHILGGTRTSLEELSLHLNKTLRDFIEEGHEKAGVLRLEEVAPAMKIVSDYRSVHPRLNLFFRQELVEHEK